MEEENLVKRIGDAYLNPNFVDGQVLLHTDMNEIVSVTKTAINENYNDIQVGDFIECYELETIAAKL